MTKPKAHQRRETVPASSDGRGLRSPAPRGDGADASGVHAHMDMAPRPAEAVVPATPPGRARPVLGGRGTRHRAEPASDESNIVADFLWLRAAYEAGEGVPTPGMLLGELEAAGVPGAKDLRAAWRSSDRPGAESLGGQQFIAEALDLALAAGLDAYATKARLQVYATAVACPDCATACRPPSVAVPQPSAPSP